MRPVFLDHHSTTPLDERVLEEMLPFLKGAFGNPASRTHRYGVEAARAVECARERVAAMIGARPSEIVFTSGGTEANNLAVKGATAGTPAAALSIEHPSVLQPLRSTASEVSLVEVDREGVAEAEAVGRAVQRGAVFFAVMLANNEVGTVQDVSAVSESARVAGGGVWIHCDAVQAPGQGLLPDVRRLGVDSLSLSSHKLYGPKGAGALWVRSGLKARLRPQLEGGGHESGLRSGTVNVPAVVGFGAACALAAKSPASSREHLRGLRDRLWTGIRECAPSAVLNGPDVPSDRRLPGNLNVSFPGVDAEELLLDLADTVAFSTGAACASARREPSHVLRALGHDLERIHGSVRFGVGRGTTPKDIEEVLKGVGSWMKSSRSKEVS